MHFMIEYILSIYSQRLFLSPVPVTVLFEAAASALSSSASFWINSMVSRIGLYSRYFAFPKSTSDQHSTENSSMSPTYRNPPCEVLCLEIQSTHTLVPPNTDLRLHERKTI